ncbi:MAG: tRNA dimethylallyltransferase [Glaciecola sp.]|jgi:tRNA dimethylallyltransferase
MNPPDIDPLDVEPLNVLLGPTASGKSSLGLQVAEQVGAEIISLDSMQVYRGMDIGTAKPSVEDLARVPHHMIDLVDTDEIYDVQRFMAEVRTVLKSIQARGNKALFVGGTGFYLAALLRGLFEGPAVDHALRGSLEEHLNLVGKQALFEELQAADPESAARLHENDTRRVIRALEVWKQTGKRLSEWQQEWGRESLPRVENARLVGIWRPVPELDARIRARAQIMLDAGWKEEAVGLRAHPGLCKGAAQALGYSAVLAWADGTLSAQDTLEEIALRTRQFARRQRTWYRKFDVHWIPSEDPDRKKKSLKHWHW